MSSVNFAEIVIVNSIGIFLMVFLLLTRIENVEKRFAADKIFDTMIWITIAGCLAEILTFVVDGRTFFGGKAIAYFLNTFCFVGTCAVGFLWCLYVDLRIYNNFPRMKRRAKLLCIPFLIDVILNLINLTGCGIVFTISPDNVYRRGSLVLTVYVILFFYFIYSMCLVDRSKKSDLHINFFPVYYVVIPCMVGTIVQGMAYGITLGWTSVAIAWIFVYIETQFMNVFMDTLSGLYNRRYMDYILSKFQNREKASMYGVMIDVNEFKRINDVCGHTKGDEVIREIGKILTDSVPDNGIAVRYAGDEFIILLRTDDEEDVKRIVKTVEDKVEAYNDLSKEAYRLSFAMGYSRFDSTVESIERFLMEMDKKMYADKQQYYKNQR